MMGRMIRTLIVEDDFAVAALHRRYVESVAGFEVVEVLDRGGPAVEAVGRLDVDLVLLDVHLPDLSGVDVLAELRAAGSGVGVVMVTAASERDTVRRALGHRVDGYLVKPFSREEFARRMDAFAAEFHAAEEAESEAGQDGEQPMSQAEIDRLVSGLEGSEAVGLDGGHSPGGGGGGTGGGVGGGTGAGGGAGGPETLPKGYALPTLQRVRAALRDAPEGETLSALEVAQACEISRVSARRYLDLMATRGEAELKPRYGRAGRPEHRYAWVGGAG